MHFFKVLFFIFFFFFFFLTMFILVQLFSPPPSFLPFEHTLLHCPYLYKGELSDELPLYKLKVQPAFFYPPLPLPPPSVATVFINRTRDATRQRGGGELRMIRNEKCKKRTTCLCHSDKNADSVFCLKPCFSSSSSFVLSPRLPSRWGLSALTADQRRRLLRMP